jgi:hypothetical protein
MNSGSVDSLNPSARCGLGLEGPPDPSDRRLRQTGPFGHLRPRPVRRVLRCRLQGRDHDVLDLIGTDHRRPTGPVLIGQPVDRCATNRRRHFPTVASEQPNRAATVLLSSPSAHPNTMRERNARACADFLRRDQRTSCSRSSSLNTNAALGRPVRGMPQSTIHGANFRSTTLGDRRGGNRRGSAGRPGGLRRCGNSGCRSGIVAALVEAERRVLVGHQRRVGGHS